MITKNEDYTRILRSIDIIENGFEEPSDMTSLPQNQKDALESQGKVGLVKRMFSRGWLLSMYKLYSRFIR